jgi:hypothetical protein
MENAWDFASSSVDYIFLLRKTISQSSTSRSDTLHSDILCPNKHLFCSELHYGQFSRVGTESYALQTHHWGSHCYRRQSKHSWVKTTETHYHHLHVRTTCLNSSRPFPTSWYPLSFMNLILLHTTQCFYLTPPIQWVPTVISPGVKRPGREPDHSSISSAEVMNGGAIPPLADMSSWHSA